MMPRTRKPRRLRAGDVVAIVSPSWGGPSLFPHVYEHGLAVLRRWGLEVREYPSARAPADVLARDARARARDINAAFADAEVKAIVASIGGDDSVRLLPFLDADTIAANPKILMGYSDTTTLLVYGLLHGLTTLHGPSIMAGFAQMSSLPDFEAHVREMLFAPQPAHLYQPYAFYSEGYPDWSNPGDVGMVKPAQPAEGWRVVQGKGRVEGELLGGCLEVLEFMKGTPYWPAPEIFAGKLFFIETSEDKPSIDQVKRMLRSYGVAGVFARVSGLLVGRARDFTAQEKVALDRAIQEVVAEEFERPDLPIVTHMDFGHTDPQLVLPLGVRAQLDCDARELRLLEAWLE